MVLSCIPAFEELTDNGRMGRLVGLDRSISEWKNVVLDALRHPIDRESLRQFVRERYEFNQHVDQLVNLYQRLLRRKGVDLA